MRSRRPIKIDKLPRGKWQVIWYGDLAYEPHSGIHSQPTVVLVLQSVDSQTDVRKRVSVQFGLLAIVPLGSIWLDGVRIEECPSDAMILRKIEVDPRRVGEVRAGSLSDVAVTPDNFLPFEKFNLHRGDTGSVCLRWSTASGEIVLLPAVEAARFYFGTSSFLLKRVITGHPALDRMWTEAALDPETRVAHMHLAPDVPEKQSTQQIARIAFDKNARRAADLVLRSARLAAAARSKIYPKMAFPFWQPATLSVGGIEIDDGNGPPRFVILRIDSCTGPYPWKRLEVTGGKVVADVPSSPDSGDDSASREGSSALSIGEGEPSTTRVTRGEGRWVAPRFVDLIWKKTVFTANPSAESGSAGGGASASDGAFGVGDGASSGTGAPLELSIEQPPIEVAFIDAGLLGDDLPADHWRRLVQELLQTEVPIQAVLIAPATPTWAIEMFDDEICIAPAMSSSEVGNELSVSIAIDIGIQARDVEAVSWHIFALDVAGFDGMRSTSIDRDQDVVATVRLTFKSQDVAARTVVTDRL